MPLLLCSLLSSLCLAMGSEEAHDWPQWRGPTGDGRWSETGVIESFDRDAFEPVWRVPLGSGYSGPTVADGRVYVMDRQVEPTQKERVLCFDQATGESVWIHEYDCRYEGVSYEAGPRASVLIHDGRAYSLGTMGHLFCLDAATGEVQWSHDLDAEYEIQMPIWGISAAPVVEGELLLVNACGTDACLVAFDRVGGEERWKALSDRGNYSPPVVVDQAGHRVAILWTGDRIVGVDAPTGALLWELPFPSKNMPLGVATPVVHGDRVFLSGFYDGCILLRLKQDEPGVEELWRRRGQNERSTDGLHTIIATPIILGEHLYGVDSYGELRCLRLEDGARVWEDQTAVPRARWATIHFVQNGDLTWMFNERGELVLAFLTPEGFDEIDRAHLIEPTLDQLNQRDGVCWSHPAFADRHVFARNDEALVCVDLSR